MARTVAERRYLPRLLTAMAVYAALLVAAIEALKHDIGSEPVRYALALAPALPLLGAIAAMGLYLAEEADEFKRAVLIQSLLWGLGFVLAASTVWGFLENLAGAPDFPLYLVFPVFCLAMGLAQPFVARRYK